MPIMIPNQYRESEGIGKALAQLGESLYGPGALKAGGIREDNYSKWRTNNAYDTIAESARRNGGVADFANPDVGASSYLLPSPKEAFEAHRGVTTLRHGAMSPQSANSVVAAGGAYSSSGPAFEQAQQTEITKSNIAAQKTLDAARYTADTTPVVTIENGNPVYRPRSEAVRGATAPISASDAQGTLRMQGFGSGYEGYNPQQQAAAGVEPKAVSNLWVYQAPNGAQGTTADGRTDVNSGVALPGGTKVMKLEGANTEGLTGDSTLDRQLTESQIATKKAVANIDLLTRGLSHPDAAMATGYIGTFMRGLSDIRSQVEATGRLFGVGENAQQMFSQPELRSAIDQTMNQLTQNGAFLQRAQQLGVDSSILRSRIQDLAFMIAKAQDPNGRISTDDIRHAAQTIGATIMDPKAAVATLGDLKERLLLGQQIYEDTIRTRYPKARTPATQGGAPAPAPAGAPAQGAPQRIRIDANGNILP